MSNYESHISVVGRSEDVPEQTPETALRMLERASTINSNTPTSVTLWDLSIPSEVESQRITRVKLNRPSREYVKGTDHRRKVPREDFGPRGRYRFVCKLVGQFKEKPTDTHTGVLHGTGCLITKDLVVTAGHVIYDSEDKWGGLTSIKVYVGYNGKYHSNLESRYGKFVAAPTEWIKDSNAKYDVGFIKLNRPFQGVNPIPFMATPTSGRKELIGIIGYPYDKEKGEYMYEHFLCADWNLAAAERNMLEYSIDTYCGQSGAAVLLHQSSTCLNAPSTHQCQLRLIGVHAYGGVPNEASVIGTAGSVFEDFILAVKSRNDGTTSDLVKVSRSPGLNQLPNFSTLTVYPPGSTTSGQLTPNIVRPQSSRNNASDQYLPIDKGKWTDDQLYMELDLIKQHLRVRGRMETSTERSNEHSEGLSTLRDEHNLLSESPKNADDNDDDDESPASRSDLDET